MSGDLIRKQINCNTYSVQYLDSRNLWTPINPTHTCPEVAKSFYQKALKTYVNVRVVRYEEKVWMATEA